MGLVRKPETGLIIDFETLDQNEASCAVLDCSVFIFKWDRFTSDNPYSFKEIIQNTVKFKLNAKDQVERFKMTVDPKTVEFWQSQPPEVRKQILPTAADITVEQFAEQFLKYVSANGPVDYWWARANNFDPPIVIRLMRITDNYDRFMRLLKFYLVRDTRSYIDAKFDFTVQNDFIPVQDEEFWRVAFKPHNSTHDVAADVLRLQMIARAEKDLELTKR